MTLRAAILSLLLLAAPAAAQEDVATRARTASAALQSAIAALESSGGGKAEVGALTRTITAYEEGLSALRAALRQVTVREAALALRFEAKRDRVAQLLGVLSGMQTDPGPLLLLHPAGPLGTARSGMMLTEVTPALQAEASTLRRELEEVATLRALQEEAVTTLGRGLDAAQAARTALSQALAARTPPPRRFIENPEQLAALVANAETLDAFAISLPPDTGGAEGMPDFEEAQGRLPLPVVGSVLRAAGEADAAGIVRPGLVIATRPQALVTAPWPATIRYRGPLLDYGNVMILEPGAGYLLILAGLGTVFGEVGEVIEQGAPLGLMPGRDPGDPSIGEDLREGAGAGGSETLYMELRQGAEPVDPAAWFIGTKE
ncbi:murein hydrolase activator EnvC family protein [Ruixingdingia sedimenti]|uniref:Peptidase M23 n=1 Tax=Ruixingdingia sedimenti TaxID=3073604 RepID=A0ABU1FE23_9RHOB|nr:peptidase M23 [Xinfangfangia sp. LG-4]MDR5655137.1 peptidase M23 [Xinfangfangia sp. LG-4]